MFSLSILEFNCKSISDEFLLLEPPLIYFKKAIVKLSNDSDAKNNINIRMIKITLDAKFLNKLFNFVAFTEYPIEFKYVSKFNSSFLRE